MITRLLILSSLLFGVMSQQCGQGWKQYGDTCYLIRSDRRWWDEARKNCQNQQADLAIVASKDVNEFLKGLIKDTNKYYWIGLHDTSDEGNFVWVDGTPLDSSQASWKPGEPNGSGLGGEDCVELRDNGQWNDENCQLPQPYICSRKQNVVLKCDESNGWSNHNGQCYLLVDEQRSWSDAASECSLVGGQLVKVESQDTQDYLNVLTSRYRRTYWIGLTNLNGNTAADYQWSDGTSLSSYNNWAVGQPNNKYYGSGGDCAEVLDTVTGAVGKWSTASCSQTLYFICQRDEGTCASGWRLFDGNCYQINANTKKTWTDAKHYCEAEGGYITSILSDRENEFIASQFPELMKAGITDIWFGMSDVVSDGNFVWSEGSAITVTHWNPGEPNNVKGQTDCGSIYTDNTDANWDTKNCYVLQPFICKIKAGVAVQNIPPSQTIGSCSPNWALFGDSCYYFGTNPKTWNAAKAACESMQASLTSILTSDEQSFLSVRADVAKDNMWIGLHDSNGEGVFEWTDSSVVSFTNWAPGEPNNVGNEDCVHLEINYYKVGMWNDLTCDREESWICKKPKIDDGTVNTQTPLPTGAFDTRCGIDWVYDSSSGRCYILRPSDYKDWAGAREQCLIEGADLVSITSYEEENFLISLLRGVTEPTMWIGANDLNLEGGWEWSDGMPFVYFNWKSGEPNNDGRFAGGENCGELIVNQGVWNDHKCEKNFIGYICEKDHYINKYFDSYHYSYIDGKDNVVLTNIYPNDCAKRCISTTDFLCKSFDYNRNQKTCQLSSYDKDSAGGLTTAYTGDIYDHYERDMNVPTDAPPTTLPRYYGCPDGWSEYGDYCYFADNTVANWEISQNKCRQRYRSANLASVHNKGENDFLMNIVQNVMYGHSTWIGMSDNNNEGTFAWVDGSEVDYTYWGQNQPDDWNTGEDCIELRYWDGTWNDNVCSGAFTSICKMKKIDVGNTAVPTDAGCEAGWMGHSYKCIKMVNDAKSWSDAENSCNAFGGYLMSIHDQYEQAFIASQLSLLNGMNFWIGLSDSATPGTYKWSDGTSVTYSNWAQGQPDDSAGLCVSITSGDSAGYWIDASCALGLPFICEKSRLGYTRPPFTNPPIVTQPNDRSCASGWIGYGSSCFKPNEVQSSRDRLTWLEARQACLIMGGDLASFHSAEEEAYILSRFTPIDQENAYWLGYWIGLNDQVIEGGFEWSDNSPVDYTNWGDGEPNDSGSEECVEMFYDGQRGWNDIDCSTPRNWVCKIDKGVTPVTPTRDPGADPPCPSNSAWVHRAPYCYYASKPYGAGRLGWQDAEEWCNSQGGNLASIHDSGEQTFIFRLVNKAVGSYWIGLREQSAGGTYRWSDGTPFDFINWAKNEPNDYNGAEQCAELEVQKLAAWNDQACGVLGPFVCKKVEDNIKPVTKAPTPVPTGNCLNGWFKHSNRCYRVYGTESVDRLGWSDARSMCLAKNADLATVHNKELQAYLSTFLKSIDADIWIGLTDTGSNGKFHWVDGSGVDFQAWASGEPDSGVILPDGSTENCVKMMNNGEQTGRWDDAGCSPLNAYVCQQPLDSSLPVNPDNTEYCGKPNFRKYGDSCYMMDTSKRDFASARSMCESQGAELASIPDGYEQVFVESLIYGNNNEPVWIGMIDTKEEGVYVWLDGWPVWYTHWSVNEPSKGPGEGCVRVNGDGYWEDAPCASTHNVLCKTTTAQKPVTPSPGPGTCPSDDWVPYGGHCYFFGVSRTSMSWAEAEFACSLNHAAHLTSIHSRAQNEFIRANVQSRLRKSVWLGLYRTDVGGFQWSDGTGVDYTFWKEGEPTMTHNGQHENCVELYPDYGYWNDENCYDGQAYVCQILKEPVNPVTGDGPNPPYTTKDDGDRKPSTAPVNPVTGNGPNPPYTTNDDGDKEPNTENHVTGDGPNPPYTTSDDGNKEPNTGDKLNSGAIVGIVLASVVLLLAVVMIAWFVAQRQKFSFKDNKATTGIDNQLYNSGTSTVQLNQKVQAEA